MQIERPDLSQVDPLVRAYIEALETALQDIQTSADRSAPTTAQIPLAPDEPPTTLNVITLTPAGSGKRTPRHQYSRQRRGGMGIFDLQTSDKATPAVLTIADATQSLLLFTNLARAFRVPVKALPESPIHSRGVDITVRLGWQEGEQLVAALPDLARGSLALLSERGLVRCLRHHVFGEYMKPGIVLFDTRQFGQLSACCWTPGDGDLFIATRQGRAIRFAEKLVPPSGGPGIKLEGDDKAVAVAPVYSDSGVFLLSADGRGTIRDMQGFNPNKSTGGSGKIAMSTSALVAAATVQEKDDLFVISRLSKIIRFMAAEVPVKEGVVQGVACISLRADETVALVVSRSAS
ncbi:MAG: DNA gyrase C-terminal beta-propeller domain-containing protein [Anaerolineales bacterium]|jgi:DNA gyrase subunit A